MLSISQDGCVRRIALHLPDTRNALSPDFFRALREAFEAADQSTETGAVVLASSSEHFSAGADVKAPWPRTAAELVAEGHSNRQFALRCTKPVIAAVRGACIGAGAELALSADMAFCDDSAFFSLPEVSMGSLPIAGTVARLSGLVGRMRAADILVTGRKVSAEEAGAIGLVSGVTSADDLDEKTDTTAAILGQFPEVGTGLKAMLRGAEGADDQASLDRERQLSAEAFEALMKRMAAQRMTAR